MSSPEYPDADYRTFLFERQNTLQLEAEHLISKLDIEHLLSRQGQVKRSGSLTLGLMVRRDIDFLVLCKELDIDRIFKVMLPLITLPQVVEAHFRSVKSSDNQADRRYYFHLFYESETNKQWQIDVAFWLVDSWRIGGSRDRNAHLKNIRRQLTKENRVKIMWLKDIWRRSPLYPDKVYSKHIYDAVLNHNVSTPAEFEMYLLERSISVE